MPRAMTLEGELAAAIEAAARGAPPPDFEPWALRVFGHQFEHNAPYRAFCVRRGVTPATVARWEDVPAVPSAAFRQVDLACGPPEAVFVTSGTTNRAARGRHLVPHLALYRCSALAGFARFVLPDGVRLPCLAFVPPPALRPASSLVQMCVWVGEALASSIEWMIGERGLETERLLARLAAAEASGEALLLVGVTAAFTKLFAACRTRGRGFRLGPASRVVDTGGQKGTTRPLSRPAFLSECWTLLGIPGYYCINEYGMTELCSQRYDSALDDRFHGRSLAPRRLVGPPWLRTRVLDPDTLAPVAPGATGLLCHHDLANAGSVSVVLTEDLGRAAGDDGIAVLGRVPGPTPRGRARLPGGRGGAGQVRPRRPALGARLPAGACGRGCAARRDRRHDVLAGRRRGARGRGARPRRGRGRDRRRRYARRAGRAAGRPAGRARPALERGRDRTWGSGRRRSPRTRRRPPRPARLPLPARRVRCRRCTWLRRAARGGPGGGGGAAPAGHGEHRGPRAGAAPRRAGGMGARRHGPAGRRRYRDPRGRGRLPSHLRAPHRARASVVRPARPPRPAAHGAGRVRRGGGRRPDAAGRGAARARRVARLPRRPHAAAAALVAARAASAALRPARGSPARGRAVSDDLAALFLRHVCQTSEAPLGMQVARAAGSTVWDASGRAYLDLLAGMGVANVGHTHPEVVAAVRVQAERHLHVMVYGEFVQEAQVRLATRLAGLLAPPLAVVYFTSSGAEAIEGALKTARKHTRRRRIVAFEGGFHGDTLGALSIGGNPVYRAPFEPLLPEVTRLPFDDVAALAAIDAHTAAAVVEPVQAEAGVRIPGPAFLPTLRRRCDETGALLVLDEVVTGFGRTGRLFAHQHWGVAPDLLVLAQALGGGLPLGAFVGSPAVMATLGHDPPLAHVTTFGGHPLSCAAGLAALEVLLREDLAARAAALGARLLERLGALVGRGGLVASRGLGLLVGLEFAEAAACARCARG